MKNKKLEEHELGYLLFLLEQEIKNTIDAIAEFNDEFYEQIEYLKDISELYKKFDPTYGK